MSCGSDSANMNMNIGMAAGSSVGDATSVLREMSPILEHVDGDLAGNMSKLELGGLEN